MYKLDNHTTYIYKKHARSALNRTTLKIHNKNTKFLINHTMEHQNLAESKRGTK